METGECEFPPFPLTNLPDDLMSKGQNSVWELPLLLENQSNGMYVAREARISGWAVKTLKRGQIPSIPAIDSFRSSNLFMKIHIYRITGRKVLVIPQMRARTLTLQFHSMRMRLLYAQASRTSLAQARATPTLAETYSRVH